MITVLVLSSSPKDQDALQLGKEHKLIKHSLDSATNRDQFRVVPLTAATIDDLRRYLLEYSPTIVHFCGHGAGKLGLCFEDEGGDSHVIDGERLAKLFHLVNEDLKCIVLNACYSTAQAEAITKHIDFVVGMSSGIGDMAAIKFAQGFYEAVWAGQSYEKAFKFGCSAIDTAGLSEEDIPALLKSPRLGSEKCGYSEETQRIENFILRYLRSDIENRASLTIAGDPCFDRTKEPEITTWTSVTVKTSRRLNGYVEAKCLLRHKLTTLDYTFYLKIIGDAFLMDWAASRGYWPIPAKTVRAIGSSRPLVVRAVAQLDDYFNYGFSFPEFISIALASIDEEHLHGYVQSQTTLASEIVHLLYDGRAHRIAVEIAPTTDSPSHVMITRLVSDSWIL